MSLILDALNKADRERQNNIDEVPNLNTVHQSESLQTSFSQRQKIVLACTILVLFVSLLIWAYSLTKNTAQKTIPSQLTTTISQTKTAQGTTKKPQAALSEHYKEKAAAIKTIPPMPKQTKVDKQLIAQQYENRSTEIEADKSISPSLSPQNVNRLYTQDNKGNITQAKSTKNIASVSQETEKVTAKSAISTDKDLVLTNDLSSASNKKAPLKINSDIDLPKPNTNSIESFANIGIIRDLPTQLQNKIPSIFYSEHNYLKNGRSYVILNGKKRYTGDQIAAKLSLQDILEDGIIARFDKHSFKMKALSSWVNM